MKIRVISEEIIKPSQKTPNHLRYLKASLFDHVNTPNLIPLIYFFSQKLTSNIGTHEVLDRLKGSLPDTLSVFYPLAGRVRVKDANYIDCNDEGVPYVHAEVANPLKDVVHKVEISQLDKLVHSYEGQDREGNTSLLLSIQINVFSCGGLAIGVKTNHATADGYSMFMFFKTWALMANGNLHNTSICSPCFDIAKVFPPLSPTEINSLDVVISDRPMGKWFMFNDEKLDALRSKILSVTNNTNNISLPMVLSSFIWSRFKVACHNSVNINIPHEVSCSVNIRRKVCPPNERSYYFGNMYVTNITKLSSNENGNDSNNECVVKVKESIGKMMNNDVFVKAMQEGKEDLRYMPDYYERLSKGEIFTLDFSDLRSLPVYEADFGWGKPVWVTTASVIYKNFVMLIPAGPSTKQIVAYIFLSREDMTELENDIVFDAFLSKTPRVRNKL